MTVANRNIIDTYSALLEGLDMTTKSKIAENLSDSIKRSEHARDGEEFFNAFVAFESEKPAEEIISDIKSSRTFRKKDIFPGLAALR